MTQHRDSISNVFIYVMDGLRWDYLPDEIKNKGVLFKTVAQGLFTPPSFSSIATGRYPQEHGVEDFRNRIPDSVPTLFGLPDISTGFYAPADVGESGIYSVLNTEKVSIKDQHEPFIHMERDPEPHLPFTEVDSVEEYYRQRGDDWERVKSEYEEAIQNGLSKLNDRIEYLDSVDLLDDTLVIVTSDHGELFGEHGSVGHSSPAVPELVYVPTVFIHPSIDPDLFTVEPETDIIEHVDITETALSSVDGLNQRFATSGTDILSDPRTRNWGHNHVKRSRKGFNLYEVESMWWPDSGHTFQQSGRLGGAMLATYQMTKTGTRFAARKSPLQLLKSYVFSDEKFGTPPIARGDAKEVLTEFVSDLESTDSISTALNDNTMDRLQRLGYLE